MLFCAKLIKCQSCHHNHIETNQLICSANPLHSFCMMSTLAVSELIRSANVMKQSQGSCNHLNFVNEGVFRLFCNCNQMFSREFFPKTEKLLPLPTIPCKRVRVILDKLLSSTEQNMRRMLLSFYFWSFCATPSRFNKFCDQHTYIFFR